MFKFLAFFKKNDDLNTQKTILIREIHDTKEALNAAYLGFNNSIDPDLIDCYIYELNSIQKRYKYLLESAKALNLTADDGIEVS